MDSTGVEDAIRNAVSLGGDADTQACIAGAIAEAYYDGVPEHLLAFVLPRLDDYLLKVSLVFATRYMPASTAQTLRNEGDARRLILHAGVRSRGRSDSRSEPLSDAPPREPNTPRYHLVMHADAWRRLEAYAHRVLDDPQEAGAYMRGRLADLPSPGPARGVLAALVNTKRPRIFAESQVAGDGSDWAAEELRLLGDVGISVPVTVFDDGLHARPRVHQPPFPATLLFVPGALLRSGGGTPADWTVVTNGRVDQKKYEALYERRLLPLLKLASTTARSRGGSALVTVPGLGCGQFAGTFRGTLGVRLKEALHGILTRHAEDLSGICAVWYDPYSECENERHEIGGISYLVRPLKKNHPQRPQLCRPEEYAEAGDDFTTCELWSMVAWDHVSWPGNDFYVGSRSTDDGVKAAAGAVPVLGGSSSNKRLEDPCHRQRGGRRPRVTAACSADRPAPAGGS